MWPTVYMVLPDMPPHVRTVGDVLVEILLHSGCGTFSGWSGTSTSVSPTRCAGPKTVPIPLGPYLESAVQQVLMSGYLGSIGFGYPAALGAEWPTPVPWSRSPGTADSANMRWS
jgi:hypothetical protein